MKIATVFESKFPKFLIGDSADDRTFVIHLHWPQFVAEVEIAGVLGEKLTPEFIDDPAGMTGPEMAALMRAAGDFYQDEISRGG